MTAYSGDEYVDEAEGPEHGEEALSAIRSQATAQGVEAIQHGHPAGTITRDIGDNDVELILLGTKRRSDAYCALLASVTDRVLRLTTRPATVVNTEINE